MPVFDGEPVKVGDRLHDFNDGQLTVVQVHSDRMQLNKPGIGTRMYHYNGVRIGKSVKTLFWHPPVITSPPKDGEKWNAQREMIRAVAGALGPLQFELYAPDQEDNPYSVAAD